MSAASPRPDPMVGLPVGTRVRKHTSRRERLGVVMPHEPEQSQGSFPVRFDDGIWEVLNASYVTVLTPPGGERAVGTERAGLAQPSHDERPEARAGSW